jgi:hypothetical protein
MPLEILSGGRALRIPGDFDPVLLRKFLSVLEGPLQSPGGVWALTENAVAWVCYLTSSSSFSTQKAK